MKNRIFAFALSVMLAVTSLTLPSVSAKAEELQNIAGDVNSDGKFNLSDVQMFQKWLLADPNATLKNWGNADFCEDGQLDVFDLCLMKHSLIESKREISYTSSCDMIFSGYKDINMGEINECVIRSANELNEYLEKFLDNDVIKQYRDKFNDNFFKENILLLKLEYQSCGTKPYLEVSSVDYLDKSLVISMNKVNFESAEDIESALIMQVEISKADYYAEKVKWDIKGEVTPIIPTNPDKKSKIISVSNILQNPELPTGCEVTSLTILLNYLGFNANKLDLARNYLPKQDFYWKNGVYYGADFRTTFAGNPESEYSYGCYAPCIVTTANKYLKNKNSDKVAYDISGSDLDTLLSEYIDNEMPVCIWITSGNLHETALTSIWTTPQGEKVQWIAYEHCVVLTGYDFENNLIYVSDPLYNNKAYDYNKLKLRYNELGKQAVCIK